MHQQIAPTSRQNAAQEIGLHSQIALTSNDELPSGMN